jgi:hypothetical protein
VTIREKEREGSSWAGIIIQDNNKKAEIDDLNPDREVDKARRLGLFNDYGFSS